VIDIIQLVPAFGSGRVKGLVTLALNVYTIVSLLLATAAVHQISKRRAALVLVAPFSFVALLALALLQLGLLA
jgi:hypothetical protein